MPRKERLVIPGIYHIINRGVERRSIFLKNDDYNYFLDLLLLIREKYKLIIHSYCLMKNHYHILLETKEENLSQAIQYLNNKYAKYFNKTYKRVGHLWQGRFHSYALYDDAHFWIVTKYIERNPIKANIIHDISTYIYQSYYQLQNEGKYLDLLVGSKIYDMTIREYNDYVCSELIIDAIDIVYKSPKVMIVNNEIKLLTKRLETFFNLDKDINRNRNIFKAYDYGYSKSEIAFFLELNPSSVSRIVSSR